MKKQSNPPPPNLRPPAPPPPPPPPKYAKAEILGVQLCELLGLQPDLVEQLSIHVNASKPLVIVEVKRRMSREESDKVVKVLEHYVLGPKVGSVNL